MDIKYFSPTIKSIRQKCHLVVTDLGEAPPILGEKEQEIREGGKAARASKGKPPPPPPLLLTQVLDLPLFNNLEGAEAYKLVC